MCSSDLTPSLKATASSLSGSVLPVNKCRWPRGCYETTFDGAVLCAYHAKIQGGLITTTRSPTGQSRDVVPVNDSSAVDRRRARDTEVRRRRRLAEVDPRITAPRSGRTLDGWVVVGLWSTAEL